MTESIGMGYRSLVGDQASQASSIGHGRPQMSRLAGQSYVPLIC